MQPTHPQGALLRYYSATLVPSAAIVTPGVFSRP
ncbi:hypothetical protein ABIC46_005040 [Variovorax paradoxus]